MEKAEYFIGTSYTAANYDKTPIAYDTVLVAVLYLKSKFYEIYGK